MEESLLPGGDCWPMQDLLIAPLMEGQASVLINQGETAIPTARAFTLTQLPTASFEDPAMLIAGGNGGIAAGDYDGDGIVDVLASSNASLTPGWTTLHRGPFRAGTRLDESNASSVFRSGMSDDASGSLAVWSVAGVPYVVVGESLGYVTGGGRGALWFLQSPSGEVDPGDAVAALGSHGRYLGAQLDVVDLDGDGEDELMARYHDLVGFPQSPDAMLVFDAPPVGVTLAEETASVTLRGNVRLTNEATTGDIDGDGYRDFVYTNGDTKFGWVPGPFEGTVDISQQSAGNVRLNGVYTLAVGDFDGDGADDIAASGPFAREEGDAVWLLWGSWSGTVELEYGLDSDAPEYAWALAPSVDSFLYGSGLATVDWDADGVDELLAARCELGVPGERLDLLGVSPGP